MKQILKNSFWLIVIVLLSSYGKAVNTQSVNIQKIKSITELVYYASGSIDNITKGSLKEKNVYKYSKKRNKVKSNKKTNKIARAKHKADENLEYNKHNCKYKYDEKGNWIEKIEYDNNSKEVYTISERTYEYY